ncbi:MAG: hypothetical protein ETSY1_04965 [Candidatus Entotheonella factor]|uniref:Uncharacterized protein n=1 Tax=Entotheonella factor TaxID=1429438 RepID=W4LVX7_ENTF1|nr:hypothetical protein [Candidatus Entotheonella palauensis]ETX02053.1 MAG: hypothetical protein ETSY1_04965 [Candidatus Entotheonella factor]
MSQALHRATQRMTVEDLPSMVLSQRDLPASLQEFVPRRQDYLDNETMAEHGMPGSSAERYREIGRITGYLQEFNAPMPESNVIPPGYDVQVASVVHLFDDPDGVARWIDDVFLHDFETNVNEEIYPDQHILAAERLPLDGFSDVSAGLRVVHGTPKGTVSSTVIDFRIGRILGVVYVVTLDNYSRLELAQELGLALERKIVRAVLGDL